MEVKLSEKITEENIGISKENSRFTSFFGFIILKTAKHKQKQGGFDMKTYLRHKIHNVISIKELAAMEYLDFAGKYKDYIDCHNFWEMCYAQTGTSTLNIEGERIPLKTGDVAFVPPEKKHFYTTDNIAECRVFVVCFETFSYDIKTLGGMALALDIGLKDCVEKIIDEYTHTFFTDEEDHLVALKNPNFGGQQIIILLLEYLIIRLLRRLSGEKNPDVIFLSKDDFYAQLTDIIIDYFQTNVSTKLSLTDVCNKVNYSRSFLCKIFKEQTGETLSSYFNRLKIQESKKLLEETNMSVTDISKELGFTDVKYFGSLFKKMVGTTPSEYKKLCRKK